MDPLRAVHSTASAASVAQLVQQEYDLGATLECRLLNRGFNDVYALRTPAGRSIVRLSGQRRRRPADVATETAFLAHLDAAGVPVAAAVPARDGRLFAMADAPEGKRAVVVFRPAAGRPPHLDAPEDAHAHGVTLARIHAATASFQAPPGRDRLDVTHLVHRPMAAVSALDALSPATGEYLAQAASRLAAAVTAQDGLAWTWCHGDCHGLNARIATEGPLAGAATFFDFDDGGFGYLAYDLAVFLWAQVSFGRQRYAMWHAFIAGYRATRPVSPADFEAVHLFVPIRHLWLMGQFAQQVTEWGTDNLPPSWLDRQADFLRAWDAERLSPRLL